ncbi:hypothetical protein, partial [Roseiconus lacunae]|uniref:hypothetical protein n=1 Tax=Roseiconus lacunae TaxID=2605694 RepID=UPI001F1BCB19
GGPTTVTLSGLCVVPNSKLEEPTSATKHDERHQSPGGDERLSISKRPTSPLGCIGLFPACSGFKEVSY